jgi:putative FmdB family regulatory protein
MPIYEYECQACGQEFEKLVLNNSQLITCPNCQSEQVTKQFSVFSGRSGGKSIDTSSGGAACGSCSSKSCSTCGH